MIDITRDCEFYEHHWVGFPLSTLTASQSGRISPNFRPPWPGLFIAAVERFAGIGHPAASDYSMTTAGMHQMQRTGLRAIPKAGRKSRRNRHGLRGQRATILAPKAPSQSPVLMRRFPQHPLFRLVGQPRISARPIYVSSEWCLLAGGGWGGRERNTSKFRRSVVAISI